MLSIELNRSGSDRTRSTRNIYEYVFCLSYHYVKKPTKNAFTYINMAHIQSVLEQSQFLFFS